jgi:HTH-type transcriptional regulator / antitoxin HigA
MRTTLTSFQNLLLDYQPRPIRSKAAYERALRHVEQLMTKPHLSRAESEMVELLSLLIEQYESTDYPTPASVPGEVLEHLLEVRGISKAQLARDTGLARSIITNVLAGRRAISKANALKLAKYFSVSISLFIEGAERLEHKPAQARISASVR